MVAFLKLDQISRRFLLDGCSCAGELGQKVCFGGFGLRVGGGQCRLVGLFQSDARFR